MNSISKYSFILIALLVFTFNTTKVNAQAQEFNIDSFNATVQKLLSPDSDKINFIIERAMSLTCEDSVNRLVLANEAKQLAEKINWAEGIYKSNRELAFIYFECLRNHTKSFEFLKENVAFAMKNGDKFNETLALEAMAKKYQKINQHDSAIEYLGKALLQSPGTNLRNGILGDIGYEYQSIGDYPKALTYDDSALKWIEIEVSKSKAISSMDTAIKTGIMLNKADIYLLMPNPEKALATYEEVRKIGKEVNNKQFIMWGLFGIGKTYRLQKQYSVAIDYYKQALQECTEINRFEDEVKVLNEMANTYIDSGVLSIAKNYADTALSLAEAQHYLNWLSKTNATLGNVYLKQDNPGLAIFYLQKSLDFSSQTKSMEDQRDAWLGLSNAYKQSHQSDKALDAYIHYISIRDSVKNIEKTNEAIRKDLENNYKTAQLKQDAAYQKKITQQKIFTYGGFGGLALVLLLAIFMYRNYIIQKKYNALLSKEKKSHLAHIEAQSNVLSDIAQIQAHEVRGPVSAIMGFVDVFNYDDLTDPNNKQVMEWIGITAQKLDTVIRNVVSKENDLRSEHKDDAKTS